MSVSAQKAENPQTNDAPETVKKAPEKPAEPKKSFIPPAPATRAQETEPVPRQAIMQGRSVKLTPNRLQEDGQDRMIFTCEPEEATDFERLLVPEYWAHVAHRLRRKFRIEVLPADSSYFAELLVLGVGKTEAHVAVLRYVDLAKVETSRKATAEDYKIEHKGANKKHCVIRISDNVIIKDGLPTKADAALWLKHHAGTE